MGRHPVEKICNFLGTDTCFRESTQCGDRKSFQTYRDKTHLSNYQVKKCVQQNYNPKSQVIRSSFLDIVNAVLS